MSDAVTDFPSLLSALRQRQPDQQLAFGICLLERSIPNYFQFQEDENWLGGGPLRAALACCWSAMESTSERVGGLIVSSASLESQAPDSENHESRYTSAAIDALAIASSLMDFLDAGDARFIVEAAEARRDTIDLAIQRLLATETSGAELENQIAAHPLMISELKLMEDDLIEIDRLSRSGVKLAIGLLKRVRAMRYGESPLPI